MKKISNRITSIFLIVTMVISLFLPFPLDSYAYNQFDNNNGNWNSRNVVKMNTDEAQLMVRVGDIDNFGFGWSYNFNPFSGKDTSVHSFPWITPNQEPNGLDTIMVVSGYKYNSGYNWTGKNRDGYTEQTRRPHNNVKPVQLHYKNELAKNKITVKNAVLQMFIDDIQPGNAHGITKGNVHYKVWINDTEIPELEKIINSLDQSGPRGKMITFQVPDRYLDLIDKGNLKIEIDDKRNGITGDGYAIDFVKLLINNKGFTNTGTIEGYVKDNQNRNIKIEGATVSAGGVVNTTTDSNGYFKLENVPAGQALVTVSKPGYKSQTKAINVVEYNTIRNQNFNLERTEKIATPTFDYNPKTPTREDVMVTINYPGNPEIKEYKINDEPWQEYNGSINMTENGIIKARGKNIYDEYENESEIGILEIHNIDKISPTATIRYSTTELTTNNVIAILEPSENVTVTNNNGSSTYTFTKNGSFTFEFVDAAGNVGSAIATVNNINTFKLEKLNVLEIQPSRRFELNANIFSGMAEKINLVQMSMVEYISSIEKINGKYDIVYVGSLTGYNNKKDMTDRRAKDLKEFVESGQLTIFKNDIFNDSLNNTKIYKNFEGYRSKSNFKLTSDIKSENIMQLYNECSKRPILIVQDKPRDYNGNEKDAANYDNSKMMNFIFDLENLNTRNNYPNPMTVKLYLDINGDGMFKEDEIVVDDNELKQNGKGYSISHRLKDVYTGLMPWKLEIEDDVTHAKSYEVGYPAYKGEKLKVRVLQIIPNKTNLYINNKNQFKPSLKTDLYDIEVSEVTINNFNNYYKNKENVKETNLNGNYDMLLFGFYDSYGNGPDLTDPDAIKAVKDFIATGQSVMFTHDTAGPLTFYRDAPTMTRNFKETMGFSDVRTYAGSGPGRWKVWDTTSAYKFNKGVITEYPYKLPQSLSIARTHDQYWELNLEEDVIPWYTLNRGNYKYNPRNYYYTFSKGNITYSGTGHSSPNGLQEQQLFINTILKASRNANHAPVLQVINLDGDNIISRSQEKFEFSFVANDIDKDPLSGEIYIDDHLVRSYRLGDINHNEPISVAITKAELERYVGEKESFTIKVIVRDSRGAMAQENGSFNIQYIDNPVLNLGIDKEQKYLVGDIATVQLKATTEKTSDILSTGINDIRFSITNNNEGIQIIGDSSWNLKPITFNPDPDYPLQTKEFSFRINRVNEDGKPYTITNTLSYGYTNFSLNPTITYSYPIAVKSGKIKVKISNNDGTAFEGAKVRVTKPDETTDIYTTDKFGVISLVDQKSGRYSFEVIDLDEKYTVKGEKIKTIDLSYDNPEKDISFELIDKSKLGLSIVSDVMPAESDKCLVGDIIDINLRAVAHNEDDSINTTMEDFNYSLKYDADALELMSDKNWNLKNIAINGSTITNNNQTKSLRFKIKNITKEYYDVSNAIEYTYLKNIKETRSIANNTHRIYVKSGKINIRVLNYKGIPYDNVSVTIKKGGNLVANGTTDNLGTYTLADQPSGNYTVLIDLPGNFTATGGNSRSFNLSYDNSVENIEFKLDDSAVIVKNGVFANKQVNETDLKVVKGYDLNLGVEFKSYDKRPDIRFELDENIDKIEFTLYRADDLSSPIKNIDIYKVERDENGDEIGTTKLSDGNEVVDLSSISGNKELKIEIPQSDTFNNHYILEYKISQDAPENSTLNNRVIINKTASRDFDIKVVPLPKLE